MNIKNTINCKRIAKTTRGVLGSLLLAAASFTGPPSQLVSAGSDALFLQGMEPGK